MFYHNLFWGGEQEPFRHFKAPNAIWGCRVVMPHLDGAHPVAPAGIYSIPRECEAGFVALAGLGTRQSCRGWRLSLGHTEQLQDLGWDHHRVEIWVLGTAWSLARNQRGSVVRAGINFGVHHPVFPFPWVLLSGRAEHWGTSLLLPIKPASHRRGQGGLSPPGPIISLILEPLKWIHSWEQSIHTFANFAGRTVGTHEHFSLSAASSTSSAPSLTFSSLYQQPIFSTSSVISFILMHLFTGND